MDNTNILSDGRDIAELDHTFTLVDSIVTKNYLTQLNKYKLKDTSKEFDEDQLENHAGLFRIKKIVYDKNENNLQKLVNVYASTASLGNNIIMIAHSDSKGVELYLGTTGAKETSSARANAEILCKNMAGNFPGSLDKFDKIALDNKGLNDLLENCTHENYRGISSVSEIGSPKEKEDTTNESYIQGIEKLIDTMQGTPFSAIFIANVISGEQLEDLKAEYELIYSKLVPFLKSDLTFNESSAEGVSKTLSNSLSTTLTRSSSSALSTGTSESRAKSEGQATSRGNAVGGGVKGEVLGINISHSISRTHSFSETSTFGTTKAQTSTIGDSEAKSEINSIAEGTVKTETTGRSLQISYINKTIQNMLSKIDEQLERLKESENYGIFAAAAYFLAQDPWAARMAASTYKGLISGNCTHVEKAQINTWNDASDVNIIKKYLKKLRHPEFSFDDKNNVTPVSVVSGRELAVLFGMPKKSIPGVSVTETAAFGRNVPTDTTEESRLLELGNLYHMGREEDNGINKKIPVKLNMDSLTMHTFITGTTGSGKSNAIYSILKKVLETGQSSNVDNKVHFMVIEPAKGEYKDQFGHVNDVKVYGTNRKKVNLLKINPFSFPQDVHVLEHIDRLTEIFNVCWPMYAAMPAVLKDALERAYINAGWDLIESECRYKEEFGGNIYPSFIDVLKMIQLVMAESRYSSDSKGDYIGALSTRIKSLTNGIYGQIFTADEISSEDLFDSNVIVDLSRVGSMETKAFIMGLLVMKLQEYRMSVPTQKNNSLNHLTILEEAHNLLKRTSFDQSTDSSNLLGKSVEMLTNSIAEMRTYGEGFIIADQAPGLLDAAVIRNTNTKIILRLPDLSDRELVGRAASLNDSQIIELSKLETGVAAVYQNNWPESVLCHIHPYEENTGTYDVQLDFTNKNENDTLLKNKIINYLLLPAPKKLEIKDNDAAKLDELKKMVYKLQLPSGTKIDLIKYFNETKPEKIQRLRSKIIYDLFNSESAIMMSAAEKHDTDSWFHIMLDHLEPAVNTLDRTAQSKILAMITNEYAEREKTPESEKIRENVLKYIDRADIGKSILI